MRKHNTTTGSITYPDAVSYAFSPIGIRVYDSDISFTQLAVSVYDSNEQLYVKMRVSPYQGSAIVDLSGVSQAMFDAFNSHVSYLTPSPSPYATAMRVEVQGVGDIFSFTTLVVWGSIFPYHSANPNPSTIYRAAGYPLLATALLREGNAAGYTPSSYPALVNYPVGDDTTSVNVGGEEIPVIDIPPVCGDAYYLRWVNATGHICHYLFEKGKTQVKTKDYGEDIYGNALSPEYENGRYIASRMQGKTAERTIELYAAVVDIPTREYLLSLLSSPLVDLYDVANDAWLSVEVNAGTTSISTLSYDDFIITITVPSSDTQRL